MGKLKFIATLALAASLLATAPATALAQVPAPMSLYGKVTAAGANVSEGTTITAYVEGAKLGETKSYLEDGASRYGLVLAGTAAMEGKTITFKIGDKDAQQTAAFQSFKSVNLDLAVVVVAVVPPSPPPATALAAFAGNYEAVWLFDNATQSWKVYDPNAPPAANTLTNLVIDAPFVVVAKIPGAFTYGTRTYTLIKGVNILSWLGG